MDAQRDIYDRRAREWLKREYAPAITPEDQRRMKAFYLRTGRATPHLMVMGSRAGHYAFAASEYGCRVSCVDFSLAALKVHREQWPQIYSVCADVRALPFQLSTFDGLWTDSVLSHIPHSEFEQVALELRRILRPGGLLSVRISVGEGMAMENRDHGHLLRSFWRQEDIKGALDLLDYGFSEAEPLDNKRAVLTFRREY